MSIRRVLLKVLVWNMRLMTRYVGFVAKPFVAWYASQEIIACGLRQHDSGAATIIFTPYPDRSRYSFFKKRERIWVPAATARRENFSGDLMHQVELLHAAVGDVYRVRAQKGSRTLSSPRITIKEKTVPISDILSMKPLPGGQALFSWRGGEQYDPMIYFLGIEDETGKALVGIYTREYFWRYPFIKKASLAVGQEEIIPLEPGKRYTAKLLLVDFEGWVGYKAEKSFVYR